MKDFNLDGINISLKNEGVSTILKLEGFLDSANTEEFKKLLLDHIEKNTDKIIIDMSDLTYIGSSALALFASLNRVFPDTEVILKNPKENVYKFLQAVGLNDFFNILRK